MCNHCHEENQKNNNELWSKIAASLAAIILAYVFDLKIMFVLAYLIAGYEVILTAIKKILTRDFFDENFLMSTATLGAMCIGEYPEAICVMLLYEIGELLQDKAVTKSEKSIKTLLKIMPEYANKEDNGQIIKIPPERVEKDDIIIIKSGEKVPVDGEIIEGFANFDTSSITGESRLKSLKAGDKILSGFINTDGMIKIRAKKLYKDSTVSKIMTLVKESENKKSQTEKFITKFAKVYTPIVITLAILLVIIPAFTLKSVSIIWIKRALTFLVISCPCSFVISVPLTFFSGLGRAAKSGILIKGSSFIQQLAKTSYAVFDKTGTLTNGILKVDKIKTSSDISQEELLEIAAYSEYYSNHPAANAIKNAYNKPINQNRISDFSEISGCGVKILLDGQEIITGSDKLIPSHDSDNADIYISRNGIYIGNITINDEAKENSQAAINELKNLNISTIILTGDNSIYAQKIANETGINEYFTELLPQDKVKKIEEIMSKTDGTVIFTGDGINDAPVLMRSDIGIAMGAIGSDAAIQAADIVITDDNIEKIPLAIKISKCTMSIAKQNIIFAISIKILFLIFGSIGLMTMWGAVFADVGVTLIAILNSLRTLKI